jgi:hypothetical protein
MHTVTVSLKNSTESTIIKWTTSNSKFKPSQNQVGAEQGKLRTVDDAHTRFHNESHQGEANNNE